MKIEQCIEECKKSGVNLYKVTLTAVSVENPLLLLSFGNTEDEAIDCAKEALCMLKSNDLGVVSAKEIWS